MRSTFTSILKALVQYAQSILELMMLKLVEPTQWQHLSILKIRLTKAALIIGDALAFALAGLLAAFVVQTFSRAKDAHWLVSQDFDRYIAWGGIVILGMCVFLLRFRHYSDRKPFWTELGEIFYLLSVLAVLDLAVLGITRFNSSRLWWALVWPLTLLFIPLGRAILRSQMIRLRLWQRPTIVVGNGSNAKGAIKALQSEVALGFEVLDFVGVALDAVQGDLREDVLRKLLNWRAEDIIVIPAMRGIPLYGAEILSFSSHEVVMLKLNNNLRYWPARLLKRFFDVVGALFVLIIGALPFLYIALLVRRDGGPAIFSHQRVGRSGKLFSCFKFRTMCVDAELQLRDLLARDPAARLEWETNYKLRDDPRITRIGKFLRQTSLDELPQLFNVIRGEMSLVGPRPIVQAELDLYSYNVDYYLMVNPGMTGLWQISGRSDAGYETRVYLDTWYVKNWSLWYDIAILFKTIKVVFGGKGAY
jgi:lipopolysaccharide/colanic/teichoic acid biosynthesis glycosyltransferase